MTDVAWQTRTGESTRATQQAPPVCGWRRF